MIELRSLCKSFGMGAILLNLESPSDSKILFQSQYRSHIDESAVKSLSENPDFRDFMIYVYRDFSSEHGEAVCKYDIVESDEDLSKKYRDSS
jgi:hypothetical protein